MRTRDPEGHALLAMLVALRRGLVRVAAEFYRFVGERDEPTTRIEAIAFADEVLASETDRLPSSVVLDVGIIEGRGWAVVECNQTYASGIYGDLDATELLPAVLRAAGPRSLVSKRDEQFLRTP